MVTPLSAIAIATPASATSKITTSLSAVAMNVGSPTVVTTDAPVSVTGATTQSITTLFNEGQFSYQPNSAIYPAGWDLSATCDGGSTWTANPNASCVNGLRSTGDLTSLGLANGQQVWQGSDTSRADGPSRIELTGGGDGWTAVVSPDGTRVYNAYHHGSPSQVDCHIIDTGQPCWSGKNAGSRVATSFVTPTRSSIAFDQAGNLYVAGGNNQADGFTCITPNGDYCTSNPIIVMSGSGNVGGQWDWCGFCNAFQGETVANNKLLGIDTLTMRVGCYDLVAKAVCAGQPANGYDLGLNRPPNSIFFDMSQVAVGSKVYWTSPASSYFYGRGHGGLVSCFDTVTLAKCSGAWPVTSGGPQMTAAPTGQAGAICTLGDLGARCFDSSGVLQSSSSVLDNLLINVLAPGFGFGAHGNATAIGSRIYWTRGSFTDRGPDPVELVCFDQATNASCPHFPLKGGDFNAATNGAARNSTYTVTGDATRPGCFWTNDNFANILVWNAATGTAGCPKPGTDFVATYQAGKVFPRLTCNGDSVAAWGDVKVTNISGGSFTAAKLTIKDSNGQEVPGWTDRSMRIRQGVPMANLAALSPSATGPSPSFMVKLVGLNSGSGEATITVSKTGTSPQLCVNLTAKAICPSLSSLANGAMPRPTNVAVQSVLDVTTTSGSEPSTRATAGARINAATVAQCQALPDPPPSSLSVPSKIGTVTLSVSPPSFTGGAAPEDLTYHYSTDNGQSWKTLPAGRMGMAQVDITGLQGNQQVCVRVKTENLAGWSINATPVTCARALSGFTCPGGQFKYIDGQLYRGNPAGVMSTVGGVGRQLNAIGYNPADGFIYGIVDGSLRLVATSSDGTQVDLGAVKGLPGPVTRHYVAGDINPDNGKLYVSAGPIALYAVDLATRQATPVAIPSAIRRAGGLGYDLVIRNGKVWSVNKNRLVSFDLATGASTAVMLPDAAKSDAVVAAMWKSAQGVAWSVDNSDGTSTIWAAPDNATTSSITSQGPATLGYSNVNDGASC